MIALSLAVKRFKAAKHPESAARTEKNHRQAPRIIPQVLLMKRNILPAQMATIPQVAPKKTRLPVRLQVPVPTIPQAVLLSEICRQARMKKLVHQAPKRFFRNARRKIMITHIIAPTEPLKYMKPLNMKDKPIKLLKSVAKFGWRRI